MWVQCHERVDTAYETMNVLWDSLHLYFFVNGGDGDGGYHSISPVTIVKWVFYTRLFIDVRRIDSFTSQRMGWKTVRDRWAMGDGVWFSSLTFVKRVFVNSFSLSTQGKRLNGWPWKNSLTKKRRRFLETAYSPKSAHPRPPISKTQNPRPKNTPFFQEFWVTWFFG